MKPRKILLLGGSGNLGVSLRIKLARKADFEVFSPTRKQLELTDTTDVVSYLNSVRPEVILNAAAWTDVLGAETHTHEATVLNKVLPHQLALWSDTHESQLIHISTDYVFDGNKSEPYFEDDSTNPISEYGVTKLQGEKQVLSISPPTFSIIRTSGLYGFTKNNFVIKMAKKALNNESVVVVEDQIMSPTNADDLSSVCVNFIEDPPSEPLYHYSNSGTTSWFGLAQTIYQILGVESELVKPISLTELNSKVRRPKQSKLLTRYPNTFLGSTKDWRDSVEMFLRKVEKSHVQLFNE